MMDIKPEAKTIKTILSSQKQFVIPRFQREYSWDKKNYQEFFNDILKGISFDKDNNIKNTQYFLGTMLFIGSYIDESENEIEVIDGQQRLTTITILFSVMSDIFKRLKEKKLSEAIFKYIMMQDDNGNKIRVIKSKSSYPYFSWFIQDIDKKQPVDANTEEEKCILETYNYFKESLEEQKIRRQLKILTKMSFFEQVDYIEILKSLRDQVLNSIVISISSKNKEQGNLIFEILNAKGKRLAEIDLIKNKIFEILSEKEPADIAEVKWENIKKNLNSSNENIGLATFYRHFWISKYKKVAAKDLYLQFLKEITTKEECINLLCEMEEESKTYINIINPSRNDYNNRKEYFWLVQSLNVLSNYFNIIQVRVVLLALFDAKQRNIIHMKELKDTIQLLEKFHFAFNAVTSKKSNKFESLYSTFSNSLRKCKDNDEAKNLIRTELVAPLMEMIPAFEEFKTNFCMLTYSKKQKKNNMKTKYVLYKIHSYYSGKEIFEEDASVEHIIAESEGNKSLNIGNLILIETDINNRLSNMPYKEKKDFYKQSKYKEVADFALENSEWSVEKIYSRAENLAELYYNKILNFPRK